jgi:hypothetical protein
MVFWVAVTAMVFCLIIALLGFQVEYRKARAFAAAAGDE